MRSNRESNRTSNDPDNRPSNRRNNRASNRRSCPEGYLESNPGRSFLINLTRNLDCHLGDDGGELQKWRIKGCI